VVLVAEPRELTIVSILGSISPDDLRDLSGHFGIPRLDGSPPRKARRRTDMRLTRLRFLPCFALTCCVGALTAHAADREFRTIVDAISSEYHTSPVHIPMFGLVNMVTFFVKPAGTKHIDLAVFDNLRDHSRAAAI